MMLILVAVGVAAMSVAAAVIVFHLDVDTAKFNGYAVKLVSAGNVERLKKLCAAVAKAPYVAAVAHTLEQASGIAEGAASKADLQGRLRDVFRAHFDERTKQPISLARSLGWMGLLSSIAVAAPAVFLMRRASVAMVAGLVGVGVGIFAVTRVARITRSRARFDELAQAMAQYFDGQRRVDDGAFRSTPADAPAPAEREGSDPTGAFVGELWTGEMELTVRNRRSGEERKVLFNPQVIKIGRLASAHLTLADASVSRLHAVIEWEAGEAPVIVDLGSASGTEVNGRRVNKERLRSGDVVRLGEFDLIVRLGPASEASASGGGGAAASAAVDADDAYNDPFAAIASDPDGAAAEPGAASATLRCSSCGGSDLREVTGENLERLRGTAPGSDTEGLRARVCRGCGRIDWYVDPALLDELS